METVEFLVVCSTESSFLFWVSLDEVPCKRHLTHRHICTEIRAQAAKREIVAFGEGGEDEFAAEFLNEVGVALKVLREKRLRFPFWLVRVTLLVTAIALARLSFAFLRGWEGGGGGGGGSIAILNNGTAASGGDGKFT